MVCLIAEDTSTPKQPQTSASTLNLIVELLCFCVKYHSYRIKYYVLRNNVVEKVKSILLLRISALMHSYALSPPAQIPELSCSSKWLALFR